MCTTIRLSWVSLTTPCATLSMLQEEHPTRLLRVAACSPTSSSGVESETSSNQVADDDDLRAVCDLEVAARAGKQDTLLLLRERTRSCCSTTFAAAKTAPLRRSAGVLREHETCSRQCVKERLLQCVWGARASSAYACSAFSPKMVSGVRLPSGPRAVRSCAKTPLSSMRPSDFHLR